MATAADVAKAEFAQSYIAQACIFEFRYRFNSLVDDQQFSRELFGFYNYFDFPCGHNQKEKNFK